MEGNGMEWNGNEFSVLVWNCEEGNIMEWNGMEKRAVECGREEWRRKNGSGV